MKTDTGVNYQVFARLRKRKKAAKSHRSRNPRGH